MKILLITPAPPRSRYGNRVTAGRWATILHDLGHRVTVSQTYEGQPCDVMIALHARRSFEAMRLYRERQPGAPLVLALTGTDIYRDLRDSREARQSLRMADRLVTLQPLALEKIPPALREKARVIFQSAEPLPRGAQGARGKGKGFPVCVVGHLREEKDPFRAAEAVRELPAASQIRVTHLGKAMNAEMVELAAVEMAANPRYRWVGETLRWKVRRVLARSRLMVLSSRMEGGANVISEAAAAGLPVLASRIPGSVGLLGGDYPGYFPVGNTGALRKLLLRAEEDAAFFRALCESINRRKPLFQMSAERKAWKTLLGEVAGRKN